MLFGKNYVQYLETFCYDSLLIFFCFLTELFFCEYWKEACKTSVCHLACTCYLSYPHPNIMLIHKLVHVGANSLPDIIVSGGVGERAMVNPPPNNWELPVSSTEFSVHFWMARIVSQLGNLKFFFSSPVLELAVRPTQPPSYTVTTEKGFTFHCESSFLNASRDP